MAKQYYIFYYAIMLCFIADWHDWAVVELSCSFLGAACGSPYIVFISTSGM